MLSTKITFSYCMEAKQRFYDIIFPVHNKGYYFMANQRTTLSQDVQTRSSVQLAFAKFLSKIK